MADLTINVWNVFCVRNVSCLMRIISHRLVSSFSRVSGSPNTKGYRSIQSMGDKLLCALSGQATRLLQLRMGCALMCFHTTLFLIIKRDTLDFSVKTLIM